MHIQQKSSVVAHPLNSATRQAVPGAFKACPAAIAKLKRALRLPFLLPRSVFGVTDRQHIRDQKGWTDRKPCA